MPITLDKLDIDKTAKVSSINLTNNLKKRLADLGLVENSVIKKIYKSPFGDPCAYLIMGSTIALRNNDCKNILVDYESRGEK